MWMGRANDPAPRSECLTLLTMALRLLDEAAGRTTDGDGHLFSLAALHVQQAIDLIDPADPLDP
jgi:hypothetical protein